MTNPTPKREQQNPQAQGQQPGQPRKPDDNRQPPREKERERSQQTDNRDGSQGRR